MAKYIDVEKLQEELNGFDMTETGNASYDCGYEDCLVAVQDVISDAPTADVVEVVRCSTCEMCKILADEFDNDWYFCMRDYDVEVSANHFCGYGKRKPNLSTIPTGLERSSDNEQSI